MGGSSKQVTGYRYFANFLLFIGNPIEKVLGINFDKRGWQTPLIDEKKNPLSIGEVKLPNLYGENEGGVSGLIHAKYGTKTQSPVNFYVDYLAKNDFPPIAYPYQSYLAFKDFYLGNSGYMKEMLLWPKRTRIRNDGREQWYEVREDGAVVCEIGSRETVSNLVAAEDIPPFEYTFLGFAGYANYPGHRQGIYGYAGSSAYGGVANPSLTETIFFDAQGEQIKNFDVVTIEIDARGRVENLEYEYVNISKIYKQEILREQVDLEQSLIIKITCKSNGQFPYVRVIGTGTTGVDSVSHGYKWLLSSLTKVADDFIFQDANQAYDINPIHKIREILTDDTAMKKPESDVNDVNFMKAADQIWDEGLGISWSITEKSCLEAIEELCGHIEAGVRVNRQTGLYEVVLFRDDWFEESEIHTIAINKIKSMSLEIANADEAINQLNVSYYNRDAIKNSSFSIAENASIRNLQGRVNAEDADFPYFMNQRNAAVVAQWKLKQMSSPVWKGSFTTAEYNARKWNRYDLLKLAWPRKWQGTITVRIMKINLGTGADVSIDFVEVVPYSRQLWSDVVIDEPIDAGVQPPLACPYEPFEMPYYLAVMALGQRQVDDELAYENNFGLVGVVAQQPQSNSLYAVMMTHDGTEGEEWLRAATINYEPVADLDQIISRTSTSFTVKDSTAIAELPIGTLIKCGSDWTGTPGEWMVFQGVDPYTGVVSVKRGALDSLPQAWGINTKLYFCGNDVAYDSTEYVAGEEVLVSALTTTPSGMLENKGSIAVEMKARAFRPYPPANVKINGEYWPMEYENSIDIKWVHRNRLQQTGGDILGFYEAGVTAEDGVTYVLKVFEIDDLNNEVEFFNQNIGFVDHCTIDLSGVLNTTKSIRIELFSNRDGFSSYQSFKHTMLASFNAPSDLVATYTSGEIHLHWEFSA